MNTNNTQPQFSLKEALDAIDGVIARAPLTRPEHFQAMQLLNKIMKFAENQAAEIARLQKAVVESTKPEPPTTVADDLKIVERG